MNLEDIGVRRQSVERGDFGKIEINREVEPPFVDRALAKPPRCIAEDFANITSRKS
jgi:hypothetical protein